jgi:pantothenate kinase
VPYKQSKGQGVSGSTETATRLCEALEQRKPAPWLVAVAGGPGSGKSTVAASVAARILRAVVVPMDGYHLPRRVLTPDQMDRRGAPDTFDASALRSDLARLKETRAGVFPAFDHAVKDPEPGAIVVRPEAPLVIVEGLYLLLKDWQLTSLFDITVFLDVDLDVAMDRVAARHLASGLASSLEEARRRADRIDRGNALRILADGSRERADLVLSTDSQEANQ